MDPTPIPPPPAAPTLLPMPAAVPFQPEPNNHPSSAAQPQTPHPPYAEMIYTAIEALKEKDGSSKHAIGKYIEQVYKEQLPSTHSTMLTHHLKRLKSNGMLVMNKKSYMIPRSAAAPAALTPNVTAPPVSASPKPRGRPRKVQTQAQVLPQVQPSESVNVPPQQQQNAEPVWAALGLEDEPVALPVEGATTEVKRTPGRPRKSEVRRPGMVLTPGRRGRPPGSKSKKRVGRPPKPQTPQTEPGSVPPESSAGTKRRPGRPPKNQSQATPIPFAAPAPVAPEIPAPEVPQPEIPLPEAVPGGDLAIMVSPRRRGRPKKFPIVAVSVTPVTHAVGSGRGRGRGRGRSAGGRGQGRGRSGGITMSPTGRSVGRPRKGTAIASTSHSGVANEDLKRKLEYFQAKIQESLAALKPHFNHESPVTSIAAIQELEVLGTMDLNAPLRDETLAPQQQQPPPQELPVQQQQPPQQQMAPLHQHAPAQQLAPQQMYPQQFPQFHMQY